MVSLIEKAFHMLYPADDKKWSTKMFLIEELTFSSAQAIHDLLTYFRINTKEDLPNWTEGLAFRLLCLLNPADTQSCQACSLYCTSVSARQGISNNSDNTALHQLIRAGEGLLYDPDREWEEASIYLIEILTCSRSSGITQFLDYFLTKDWLAMPPWLRNLAFRLVCLSQPENAAIRRAAAMDIRPFGDWDHIAEALNTEAAEIERSALS